MLSFIESMEDIAQFNRAYVGYCYGKTLKGEKTWRVIGTGENGQLEDRGRCSHEHVRQIIALLEHVRYKQSGIIFEGYGVIESFEFKTPPPTFADRLIVFVRQFHCWPAIG